MLNDKVWPRWSALLKQRRRLAERMLATLDAAQAVGGDIRGGNRPRNRRDGETDRQAWKDRIFDLRVDAVQA